MAIADLHCATDYANRLLRDVGATLQISSRPGIHPALRWAQSGAMALTGYPDGPAQMLPVPLASCADGVVAALDHLDAGSRLNLDGAQLLGERAAFANHRRAGAVAPGGGCRLLAAADGWLAVNLVRSDDWEVVPAWLQMQVADWEGVTQAVKHRNVSDCVEQGRLLGLAITAMDRPPAQPVQWCKEIYRGAPRAISRKPRPLVIDLASLWAGPLCTHLWQMLGAQVIKVESTARPDGMRQGATGFYDLLNAGKASVALDFSQSSGREQLRQLLLRADLVVEASRPRALRQLGIQAEEILNENPGATWIGICGYGRDEPAANWIAFGDDAGVAAGLSQVLHDCSGLPMFCGDAIADPLTGLHAALAGWSSHVNGGGRLLSVALCDVVAHCIQFAALGDAESTRARADEWRVAIAAPDIAAPHARPVSRPARPLGADTTEILTGLGIAC